MSFRILGWAGADVGTLPKIAGSVGAAAAFLYGPQRFELSAGAWLGRSVDISPYGAGGTVSLIAGTAATCRNLLTGRVELGPCIGIELGRLHASGYGVSSPDEAATLWAALKAGAAVSWFPVPQAALVLRLDAAVPLSRPRFVLDGVGPVHRISAVAGRAAAGAEMRF
jgi:hypothetical protein